MSGISAAIGHQIVRHVAVGELPALIVNAVLEQRPAETLYHAAADLLVDELRIDHGAAVSTHQCLSSVMKPESMSTSRYSPGCRW
jgi:hypothetical protein